MFSLPVGYKHKKSAWMDEYGFKDWFVNEFVSAVKKHLKNLKIPSQSHFGYLHNQKGLKSTGKVEYNVIFYRHMLQA